MTTTMTTPTTTSKTWFWCPKNVFWSPVLEQIGALHLWTSDPTHVLKKQKPYKVKNWIVFREWMERSKKWMRTSDGWNTPCADKKSNPNCKPAPDGNLTRLMTTTRLTLDMFEQICFKKNRNVFQVARLWTHHFIQIQLIKTPSDICIYEEKMPVLSENKLDMYMLILFMCQSSMFSRNDEIIHWECVCVEIPPTGNPCTKLLEQMADDASSKEKLMLKINAT